MPDREQRQANERSILLAAVALGVFWQARANDWYGQPLMALLLLAGVLAGLSVWYNWPLASWWVLGYAFAVGLANRLLTTPFVGSDVMAATREGIDVLAAGHNPYTHHYLTTNPAGSPFPYLPGEIAFYAIPKALFGDVAGTDKWAGIGVVCLLAVLGLAVGPAAAALGTALYATFGAAVAHALDGSNDTSLAFLVVLSVVLLALSERGGRGSGFLFYVSAAAFAWSLLFKEFAWLLYPFVALYLWRQGANWRGHVAITVGIAVLVILPFLLWNPAGFVRNVVAGVTFHRQVSGLTIWMAVQPYAPHLLKTVLPLLPAVMLVVMAVVAAAMAMRPASNLGLALFQGLVLTLVAFWLSRRSTTSYYTYAAAVFAAVVTLSQPADALSIRGRLEMPPPSRFER